MKRTGKQN